MREVFAWAENQQFSILFKMNLAKGLTFRSTGVTVIRRGKKERNSMRLLVGFMLFFAALMGMQRVHPDCSMTDMTGVEWLECHAK